MNFLFDLRTLPEDKLPYAVILSDLLGKMDAGPYSFEQLDKKLNIHTGGFSKMLNYYLPGQDDSQLMPLFRVHMKTTVEKLDTAFHLLTTILCDTRFNNSERLYELLKRHQSQVETSVTQNGFGVAANRLESYYSRRGVFTDKTKGLDYYWFITQLTRNFSTDSSKVIADLKEVYHLLFTRNNLLAATTCSEQDSKPIRNPSEPLWLLCLREQPYSKPGTLRRSSGMRESFQQTKFNMCSRVMITGSWA